MQWVRMNGTASRANKFTGGEGVSSCCAYSEIHGITIRHIESPAICLATIMNNVLKQPVACSVRPARLYVELKPFGSAAIRTTHNELTGTRLLLPEITLGQQFSQLNNAVGIDDNFLFLPR